MGFSFDGRFGPPRLVNGSRLEVPSLVPFDPSIPPRRRGSVLVTRGGHFTWRLTHSWARSHGAANGAFGTRICL
jgi:hypothetical protein